MPPFNFDPRRHNSAPLLLPNDDYEFKIVSAKFTESAKPNEQGIVPFGIGYTLEITRAADPNLVGKTLQNTCYLHTEASGGIIKGFLMAALGYQPSDNTSEDRFNEDFGDADWGCDNDAKNFGSAWNRLVGARVAATATITLNKKTSREQNQFRWFVAA